MWLNIFGHRVADTKPLSSSIIHAVYSTIPYNYHTNNELFMTCSIPHTRSSSQGGHTQGGGSSNTSGSGADEGASSANNCALLKRYIAHSLFPESVSFTQTDKSPKVSPLSTATTDKDASSRSMRLQISDGLDCAFVPAGFDTPSLIASATGYSYDHEDALLGKELASLLQVRDYLSVICLSIVGYGAMKAGVLCVSSWMITSLKPASLFYIPTPSNLATH